MAEAGGDVLSVDHRVSLDDAWRRIGPGRGIQGNLDATRLLAGWDATEEGARDVLRRAGGRPGHIFNLGHGVLPDTEPELLRRLVDLVHEVTAP
jgi:uroporphyrinogen decarboxylase